MIVRNNGKLVKIKIYNHGDSYMAMASTKDCSVWNCYGTRKEKAKELALFRLNQVLKEETKELEVVVQGNGYTFYREAPPK
ncbi:hypothetical protein J7E63_18005 [Bacillus sp. ISL-75]|uniref:hypothetical protein n=1 Tax=Bacillus sp. ISL-75 TaxID=2819137 RepID=UPI001BE94137|nr:hypothetical protein [Bacillus sp. ISL-75]MBT2728814.1 hypothetical protein [Bacillus sp. ISL-75]